MSDALWPLLSSNAQSEIIFHNMKMQQCGFLYYCSLAGACTCKQMLMFKCRSHLPDAGHFQGDITVCSLQHLEIPLHIMHLSMSYPGVRRGGGVGGPRVF